MKDRTVLMLPSPPLNVQYQILRKVQYQIDGFDKYWKYFEVKG